MEEHRGRWDVTKILRFFTKEEVKTPLSFFFKVLPYLTAAWLAILYAPVADGLKRFSLIFSSAIFVAITLFVGAIALFRPTHLVYGESSHRAERKLEFGTETRSFDETTLNALPSEKNPPLLERGPQ